jgi:hypothetical protein
VRRAHPETLESNLGAVGLELADELVERLGALGVDREAYWESRAAIQRN